MVLTLLAITFVSAAAVGTIYEITQEPIAAAKSAKIGSAVALVVPPFDNNPDETKTIDSLDGKTVTVYTALSGQDTVGYAIETFSNSGFGGEIRLMVGFLPDGTIHRVETLSHNETPGLGDKIDRSKSDFSVQFEEESPNVPAGRPKGRRRCRRYHGLYDLIAGICRRADARLSCFRVDTSNGNEP